LKSLPCMSPACGLTSTGLSLSGTRRVTNPGKTGGNQLLPLHYETIQLSCAKPDGMGFMLAADPGLVLPAGVFLWEGHRPLKYWPETRLKSNCQTIVKGQANASFEKLLWSRTQLCDLGSVAFDGGCCRRAVSPIAGVKACFQRPSLAAGCKHRRLHSKTLCSTSTRGTSCFVLRAGGLHWVRLTCSWPRKKPARPTGWAIKHKLRHGQVNNIAWYSDQPVRLGKC
jgi:hypothetical protein